MKTPQNKKQMRSFLGFCSYYRKFVPGFAKIAAPLHESTKETIDWTRNPGTETALITLKNAMINEPLLQLPNFEVPIQIVSDASDVSLGAVLEQQCEPEPLPLPVMFASQILSSSEQNYSVTEREALAVLWALDQFRAYIFGTQVKIITDQESLKWLKRLKNPTGRLA